MSLLKNYEAMVTAHGGAHHDSETSETVTNSVILVLNQGDKVCLKLQEGGIEEHSHHGAENTFSGFKLF